MTRKKWILLIIAGALLSSLLAGCCPVQKNRNVRGAVLPIPASGDASASDLLITNWDPMQETETVYVTYVVKDGNTRKTLWEKEIAKFDGWYIPRAIFDESRVYYLAGDRLLAFDQKDGSTAWEASVDVGSFVWEEIAAEARRVVHEVDRLARAYGWREADILAMTPARRRTYLALVE